MRNGGFEMACTFRLFYAVIVTKFVGIRGHKVPFRMMNRYASRFSRGIRRGVLSSIIPRRGTGR